MRCAWQCEINPLARKVLEKHWPDVPKHDDIRTFYPKAETVDVVCGGFPCQGISNLGAKTGLHDQRSGLWSEFARIVGEVRPRFVVVENVPAITKRGLLRVLGDLAAFGYDAEWETVPASAFGAKHQRSRLFVVAYTQSEGGWAKPGSLGESPPSRLRSSQSQGDIFGWPGERKGKPCRLFEDDRRSQHWDSEPAVGRLVHGFPGGLDRNELLGNAVVPQVAEWIGRRLMEFAV